MVRVQGEDAERVYAVADRGIDAALRSDGSLFTPGKPIWSAEQVADLYQRFVENPDLSATRFDKKFAGQLLDSPPETYQLAGELLYMYFLISAGVYGSTKRKLIEEVLSWSPTEVSIPTDLAATLDRGLAGTGTAFNTQRPAQLAFLLEFARAWKQLPGEQQQRALDDPWEFKELAFSVPHHSGYTMREAVIHLVHPDTFERIVSREAKKKIAQRFATEAATDEPDVDRRLLEIRQRLAPQHGDDFDFYDPPLRSQWQPDTSPWGQFITWAKRLYAEKDFDEAERDYKLKSAQRLDQASAALGNEDQDWVAALRRGFGQQNLTPWQQHDRFLKWVEAYPDEGRDALNQLWTSQSPAGDRIRAFLEHIPGAVLSGPGGRLAVATFLLSAVDAEDYPVYRPTPFQRGCVLTGHPHPQPGADEASVYVHALGFLDALADEAAARGLDLRDRLDAQGVLWAVTKWDPPEHWDDSDRKAFLAWRGCAVADDETTERTSSSSSTSSDPLLALAEELTLDPAFLARARHLLELKRQVVFYGPPGTGKTFVAERLAQVLTGHLGRVELVQFHPSYAYEDFIEGYRPDPDSGGFRLVDGPLKRLAKRARENPGETFVLLIDELNRGNLATVFGELYFLLEYRDRHITLQYSSDRFSLPDNLWVIGTMNTADRSIALLDAALRRRFYFVGFIPDEWPIKDLLRTWLDKHAPAFRWVADVVDEANRRLADRHAALGPSHFMPKDKNLTEERVELVWDHAALPYIEDRLFGEPDRLADFSLETLRSAVTQPPSTGEGSGDHGEPDDGEEHPDGHAGAD